MKKTLYTKEDFINAAKLGEVSIIDAHHVVSLLDEVTMRKLIDLDDEVVKKLSHKAIDANTNLKNYIENLCIKDAFGGSKKESPKRKKKQ